MAPEVPASSATAIVFGAKMLRLAVAFDSLKMTGLSHEEAIAALRGRRSEFGSDLVEALASTTPPHRLPPASFMGRAATSRYTPPARSGCPTISSTRTDSPRRARTSGRSSGG